MTYKRQHRERVMEYRRSGHTLEETSREFKISVSTIRNWERRFRETGTVERKEFRRSHKKVDPQTLETYIQANPAAYQSEVAQKLGYSQRALRKALRKLALAQKLDRQSFNVTTVLFQRDKERGLHKRGKPVAR